MQLNHLSDEALFLETERLVKEERGLLTTLLHHLREIDRRRLYSAFGYRSLFEYAVRKLGYPEDQAQRRIAAMREVRDVPELESKLQSGAINITHIGLARAIFKREQFNLESRMKIYCALEHTSTREAAKILAGYSPVSGRPDSARPISPQRVEMRFTASETLLKKIETLKGQLAHRYPSLTYGELFEMLCDLGLDTHRKTAAPRSRDLETQSKAARRRIILSRGKCEKCGSRHALEVDHKIPKALGGLDTSENLRLLCRNCNQRAAIEAFGQRKMDHYLNV
jgi:hypothetical protein